MSIVYTDEPSGESELIKSVIDYLFKSYSQYPNKTSVVYKDEEYTYTEVLLYSKKIASFLIDHVEDKNKPVIVFMRNTPSALISFFGIAMSGNIYVPLDIQLPIQRIEEIIKIVDPAYIIDCCGERNELYDLSVNTIKYDDIIAGENKDDEDVIDKTVSDINDVDPLYILFTSGSTGVPKGVTVNHRAVIDFVEEASEYMEFSEEEIFLNQAPFYFDASVPDIYCTIRNAATLHIIDNSMFTFPIKVVDHIEKNRINALYWVPSALITLANFKVLQKRDIRSLRKIMFCGEIMPVKQLNMWRESAPSARYVNYYGPSETTYACSYYEIDRDFSDDEVLPIGRAAKNTDIIILDNDKEVLDPNCIGEICVRGSCLAIGYYNSPERTDEAFVQNPLNDKTRDIIYKTGDLGHYGSDGLIYFDGRKDHQIKLNGYRIELGEIETLVMSFDGVDRAACVFDSDEKKIYLFYQGNVADIKEMIKGRLPEYMVPHRIIQLDELPQNRNGKIDRTLLARMGAKNECKE